MPIIASVIAKGLAFVDALLGNFATVVGTATLQGAGACQNLILVNVEITPCGTSVANALAGFAEIGLVALNYLFAGLLAV
jgi:hypothetical protein